MAPLTSSFYLSGHTLHVPVGSGPIFKVRVFDNKKSMGMLLQFITYNVILNKYSKINW